MCGFSRQLLFDVNNLDCWCIIFNYDCDSFHSLFHLPSMTLLPKKDKVKGKKRDCCESHGQSHKPPSPLAFPSRTRDGRKFTRRAANQRWGEVPRGDPHTPSGWLWPAKLNPPGRLNGPHLLRSVEIFSVHYDYNIILLKVNLFLISSSDNFLNSAAYEYVSATNSVEKRLRRRRHCFTRFWISIHIVHMIPRVSAWSGHRSSKWLQPGVRWIA